MTPDAARALVLAESFGDDGIMVAIRMGQDPGPDRMAKVIAALRVLFDDLRGARTLDRPLAHALFALAFHTERQFDSWSRPGLSGWTRSELGDFELPALTLAVESVLEGVWVDLLE